MSRDGGRHRFICVVMMAVWTALLLYLGFVQLVRGSYYRKRADGQQWRRVALPARRGTVYDRAGRALTLNRSTCSIQVLPKYATNADTLAAILARSGLGERRAVRHEIRQHNAMFLFRDHVNYSVGQELHKVLVRRQYSNCAYVIDDFQRLYPQGEACADIVGFIGKDRGLAGIESEYDSILRGCAGTALLLRDGVGQSYPYPSFPVRRPVAGADIFVTLDADVQRICLEELRRQVTATRALSGSAVVLDATTGAILGLCDYPSYDPTAFADSPRARYKVAALSDEFEPGSSYKLVVCAAALESPNAYQLTTRQYDVSSGYVQIGKRRIHDSHRNKPQDFTGVFTVSSNVGCAMISMQLDPRRYYEIERALGFGSVTGIGLPGEGDGYVDPPQRLKTLRFANVVFGQGVTVTLLQLAAAYLCVASDGVYMRPYLMDSVRQAGRIVRRSGPARVRQALSPATAMKVKEILHRVVTEGTGTLAQIPGVTTCGKTGTAQKVEPWGGYSRDKSRMTFVGFFPKEKPRYVVAVLVDEPKTERFAGTSACPLFREIGRRLLLWERMQAREAEYDFVRLQRPGPARKAGRPDSTGVAAGISATWR